MLHADKSVAKDVVVFDLCGTLYHSNTTFDFIKFYHEKHSNTLLSVKCFLYCSLAFKVLNKLFGFSIRSKMISTLAGIHEKNLAATAELFYSEYLSTKRNVKAFEFFEIERSRSDVTICSASLSLVVDVVARELNVKSIASELEIDDKGLCSGKLKNDVKGRKLEAIAGASPSLVVTDNLDDLALCLESKKCVLFSKRKNFNFWRNELYSRSYEIHEV